ncbi:MAG: DHHA1 domain-containing protein [bacterium]
MTERLYYQDSKLLEFQAKLIRTEEVDGWHHSVLDCSAFYPTSGGQMHDLGMINDIPVVDVVEDESGEVVHVTDASPGEVGTIVRGRVDGRRRMRHSRQHTAQHILSQAFDRLHRLVTVSVHLGEEYGALELGVSSVTRRQCAQVEDLCQRIIEENRAVEVGFFEGDQLAVLPLRKPPKRSGRIRVVSIPDFECSACGGTHCQSTGEVLMIKIVAVQKLRGHALVKFLCGLDAYADYRRRFEVSDDLSRQFTCHFEDLPAKILQLSAERKSARRQVTDLYRQMLPAMVDRAAETAVSGEHTVVAVCEDIPDQKLAGQYASLLADRCRTPVLVINQDKLHIAVPENHTPGAGDLANKMSALTDLKGGGQARAAQMGPATDQFLAKYRAIVERILDGE